AGFYQHRNTHALLLRADRMVRSGTWLGGAQPHLSRDRTRSARIGYPAAPRANRPRQKRDWKRRRRLDDRDRHAEPRCAADRTDGAAAHSATAADLRAWLRRRRYRLGTRREPGRG